MIDLAWLAESWRERAAFLRRFSPFAAEAFEEAADQLARALRNATDHVLTLTEASAESGYTPDHLSRMIREGTIPNAGRKNAPRIRRGDLPRKPSRVAESQPQLYDPAADARKLASRLRGGS